MKKILSIVIMTAMILTVFPYAAFAGNVSVNDPVSVRAVSNSYNSIRITWAKTDGADNYMLYRATSKNGRYKRIAKVTASHLKYIDKKLKNKKTYYYKLRAAGNYSSKSVYSRYSTSVSAKPVLAVPSSVKAVGYGYYNKAKITWKKSSGATGYRIYRATSKKGRYKRVKTVSSAARSYINKGLTSKAVYYYKVYAIKKAGRTTYKSKGSAVKSATVKYKITGSSSVTASKLAAYYNRSGHTFPSYYKNTDTPTLEAFCSMYVSEATAEGIKPEVVFCQAMLETGWLTFKGDVKISQNNFAGLGAVGGGAKGNSFSTVQLGIRAQVQHMKAYANKTALVNKCVDSRFKYVKRGCAAYVEWLGMKENPKGQGWAASRNYGYTLVKMIKKL